jgi:hypothetical protein
MKKNLHLITSFFLLAVILTSCSTNKELQVQLMADMQQSKEENRTCFVEYKDGSTQSYTSLKLVTGAFKVPHLLADGKTRIYANQIKAYQNKEHYAISQETINISTRSYVAVSALPGFAIRIVKGKLNLYDRKFYNSHRVVDEFFLQYGETGEILKYSPSLMHDLIKNSPEAVDFFNNKKHSVYTPKKLKATAEIFNNSFLMSKN